MAFKTKEQVEEQQRARLVRQFDDALADHAKRADWGKKRVVVTLSEAPHERHAGGYHFVKFSGAEPGSKESLSAVYFVADHEKRDGFGRDDLQDRLESLRPGDQLSMGGYLSQHKWADQKGADRVILEFKAQFFERGDVSLDDMKRAALARIELGRPDGTDLSEDVTAPRDQNHDELTEEERQLNLARKLTNSTARLARRNMDPDLKRDLRDALIARFEHRIRVGQERAPLPRGDRPKASPTLVYASGNIIDDRAQVLVNTVNCQLSPSGNGVMGKGVAKAFKESFPSIMKDYENAIRSGELRPGRALLFDLPDGRKWVALATKDRWQDNSREEWVDAGLKELGEKLRVAGLSSVALTPPGCGNGGLDWKRIEPMVHRHLAGIDVAMYARPSGVMEPPAGRQAAAAESSAKDKALAALGGERGAGTRNVKSWSEEEIIKAIPKILSAADGHRAYAGIGARETPEEVAGEMKAMASVLEARGFVLRSGGADGKKVQAPGTRSADISFEAGVSDKRNKEIFIPWAGFANSKDGIVLPRNLEEKARSIAAAAHPGWDACSDGAKKLHTRNVPQVLGQTLESPSQFVLCWTKGGAFRHGSGTGGTTRDDGGTGQAIRIASQNGVPVLNLQNPRVREAVLAELGLDRQRDRGKDLSAVMDDEDARNAAKDERRMRHEQRPEGRESGIGKEFDLTVPETRSRLKAETAYFCKVKERWGGLSNMSNAYPYEDGGVRWKSSEAQYQAARFPQNPELQEAIRNAPSAYGAKLVAYDHIEQTRPDWDDVKVPMMAYAITRKLQNEGFREELASTEGKDIVEVSTRDPFWGAQPRGDQLVGRDVLGGLLTQLRDGARMDDLPPGTSFPGMEERRSVDCERDLPEPVVRTSMSIEFGDKGRKDLQSSSSFEAVVSGERTSTTRFAEQGTLDRWQALKAGDVVRFYEDGDMRGRSVDVVVTGTQCINLSRASDAVVRDWSKAEGWSEQAGREFGRVHGEGMQIRYALPGTPEAEAALCRSRSVDRDVPQDRGTDTREVAAASMTSPSPSQIAAMSDKQKWLSAMG